MGFLDAVGTHTCHLCNMHHHPIFDPSARLLVCSRNLFTLSRTCKWRQQLTSRGRETRTPTVRCEQTAGPDNPSSSSNTLSSLAMPTDSEATSPAPEQVSEPKNPLSKLHVHDPWCTEHDFHQKKWCTLVPTPLISRTACTPLVPSRKTQTKPVEDGALAPLNHSMTHESSVNLSRRRCA
jgi:hypothetical protein